MPTLSITTKKEEAILAALSRDAHASRVARALGDVSYATVWRVAARAGIDLTAGRAAKGYKRLPAERRAKVEDAVRAIPERRRTSSRARPVSAARPSAVWCVRAARLWRRPDDAHFRKPELEPGRAGLFHRRYGDTCDVIELQPGDREVIIASGLAPGAAEGSVRKQDRGASKCVAGAASCRCGIGACGAAEEETWRAAAGVQVLAG